MNGSITEGAQGICPDGWHMPSDNDWKELEINLGLTQSQADGTGWRGSNQGSKMSSHVADENWDTGNLTNDAEFNTSGFIAGPSGYRDTSGYYNARSAYTAFLSSSESGAEAWLRYISDGYSQVGRGTGYKTYSFSVRCVKDTIPQDTCLG